MEFLSPELLKSLDERFTVLVSHRRAAHALRLAFARQAVAAGQRAWLTPDVLTSRAWAERLWFQCRPADAPRLLSPQQLRLVWERIVADSPQGAALLDPASAARAAARSWELAQAYGIPLAEIASGGEDAAVFAGWAERFEHLCSERRWLAPVQLPGLLRDCENLPEQQLHLALYHATPAEAALFDRIEQAGGTIRRDTVAPSPGQIRVCTAADPTQELVLAARWSRECLEKGAASIGIVVPQLAGQRHRVRRILTDEFAPGSQRSGEDETALPFIIAASGPLTEFPLIRTALDLLQLVQGKAPATLAGSLLRSPFLAGFKEEETKRAAIDLRLRETALEHFEVPALEHLARSGDCPLLGRSLAELRALLPRTAGRALPSEWAELFQKIWATCGWPGERTLNGEEQQTVLKLQSALGEFGAAEDLTGRIAWGTAVAGFQQWLAETSFEPQTPPAPITVLDPDSAGMRFEALWIAGCDDTRWPPPPSPDPFLPLDVQRRAGVPGATAADVHARALESFAALRSSASEVVCSWATQDDDVQQSRSPFLKGCEEQVWVSAPRGGLKGWLYARRPVPERLIDAQAPRIVPGFVRGGAHVLELQSWCPFRAQAELRLGARALSQNGPGIDARERGTLIHKALESLWGELRSHAGLMAVDADTLRGRVHALLERLSAPLYTGASPHRARLIGIEVDIATTRICNLLELERQRQPFEVLERPEFAQQYSAAGLTLDLAIDRIDVLDSNAGAAGEVVIDYKTGTAAQPARWWADRPEQPQLPLYAVARRARLAAVTFGLLHAGEAGFKGVAREEGILPGLAAHPASRLIPVEAVEWPAMLDRWQRIVDGLLAEFASGEARVDPLPQACSRCHLAGFCRIDRRAVPAGDPS